jgi:hypothetical protein
MIPIYRLAEGRSQLKNNEATFNECLSVLQKNGTLLIFSEGVCKNDWSMQPLKKGTARLAFMAWQKALPELIIRPISLSYSSFRHVPVNVWVKEGEPINRLSVDEAESIKFYHQFNPILYERLESNLLSKEEAESNQTTKRWKPVLLAIPAFTGWITHKWLYNALRTFVAGRTVNTVFFHSVLFAMLLVIYPIILIAFTISVALLPGDLLALWLLFVLPFTAWCYKVYKL